MNSRLRPYFLCLFFLYLFIFQPTYSQYWLHGIKAAGSGQMMYNDSDIAVDGKGNMVIAGQYNNSISFGEHTIVTDNGYPDIFLCRIRSDYEVEWLISIEAGFNNGDEIAVSLDDEGNIYLTGTEGGNIFVSKYNSSGNLIWDTKFGGNGYGTSVKTDMFDNVYVSGGDGWNFFMAKLSYFGDIIWVKNIWVNYSAGCSISDIDVDPAGNIYFAGKFEIDLPLDDIKLKYTNSWGPSVFWGKMNSNGKFIWAKSGSGRSTDKISLALTSSGHLILAGGVSGNSVNLGGYSVPRGNCCNGATPFIAMSDLDGNVLWAKAGTQNYYGSTPWDIQVDHSGNIYLTGSYFTCYGTFCTEGDNYLEKYNSDGVPVWRKDYASSQTDGTRAIDTDNNGLLYQLGVNSSPTFIEPNMWSPVTTYGVGIIDTESSTYKKTPRPIVDRLTVICKSDIRYESGTIIKNALGNNIQWYADPGLSDKVAQGNLFTVSTKKSDTLYVTQTLNGIESWPKPVIIKLVSLPENDLILRNDTIFAPTAGEAIRYQWFFDGIPIENATKYFIKVDTSKSKNYSKFNVLISEESCQKILTNIITAVDDGETIPRILCYPNPTTSKITISSSKNRIISDVRIRNVLGKEIAVPFTAIQGGYIIDFTDQQSGIYLIELLEDKARIFSRIIKQ